MRSLNGDSVYVYVHENVPGVTMSVFMPKLIKRIAYLRQPPSQAGWILRSLHFTCYQWGGYRRQRVNRG